VSNIAAMSALRWIAPFPAEEFRAAHRPPFYFLAEDTRMTTLPGWRNGLRRGLKILDPKGFVGSNPTPGTQIYNQHMNKKGFAPLGVILLVVAILLVAGAIWYWGLRPIPAASNNTMTSAASGSPVAYLVMPGHGSSTARIHDVDFSIIRITPDKTQELVLKLPVITLPDSQFPYVQLSQDKQFLFLDISNAVFAYDIKNNLWHYITSHSPAQQVASVYLKNNLLAIAYETNRCGGESSPCQAGLKDTFVWLFPKNVDDFIRTLPSDAGSITGDWGAVDHINMGSGVAYGAAFNIGNQGINFYLDGTKLYKIIPATGGDQGCGTNPCHAWVTAFDTSRNITDYLSGQASSTAQLDAATSNRIVEAQQKEQQAVQQVSYPSTLDLKLVTSTNYYQNPFDALYLDGKIIENNGKILLFE
jgi:hypothetical protein